MVFLSSLHSLVDANVHQLDLPVARLHRMYADLCSEDRFDKYGVERSRAVRELVRRIGIRVFVLWYPLTILFFSTFGGVSFQLPESVQTPYWLMVTFLFVFYVIWTAEGLFGKKIVGQSSILNEPIDGFIDLAREGMETIARVLVYVWRRVMRAIGHPQTEPIEAKLVMRVFFSVVALVVITLAYFVEHLTGYDLLYAFGIPLYVILFASVFIGWLVKRKRRGKLVPLPQVS